MSKNRLSLEGGGGGEEEAGNKNEKTTQYNGQLCIRSKYVEWLRTTGRHWQFRGGRVRLPGLFSVG